MAYLSSF